MRNGLNSIVDTITKTPLADQLDLANRIIKLYRLISEISTENIYLKEQIRILQKRIYSLEHIIEPDKIDIYSLNKQIERLAQKIAILESNEKKRRRWWSNL